jgi:hypothetical protein
MRQDEKYRVKKPPQQASLGAVVAVLVIGALAWFFFGGGLEKMTGDEMGKIESQVAEDAAKQYEIAKRNGTAMDRCVHAGLTAAAYIQAKNETEYARWKQVEKGDCATAGVPR